MTTTPPLPGASFRVPGRILFGDGVRARIGEALREVGAHRPIIVTDGFHAGNGVADEIAAHLNASGAAVTVFSGTVPDPTMSSVSAAVAAAVAHDADCVVGLGGGSPLDTAKAVALLAVRGGEMRDFKAPAITSGPALPIIAVPTTAGSGSEATQFTIITDDANSEKMLCVGPVFLPAAAVVDPQLTASMPQRLTADTGIDALTHAVEAYVSRKANALSDVFALEAIALVRDNLRESYRAGTAVARERMMLAALLAGIAFSNSSVALVHGMSRPLGAHFAVPHGLSNALLFAEVTRFSLPGAPQRYADCARAFGLPADELDPAVAGLALADALEQLARDLDVPTLGELGVTIDAWRAEIPTMAQQALDSGSPANNPVVPTHGEISELFARIHPDR